jgi:chemotaxis protein MotB
MAASEDEQQNETFVWISFSDLMTSLMMIFLVLAILLITSNPTEKLQSENTDLKTKIQNYATVSATILKQHNAYDKLDEMVEKAMIHAKADADACKGINWDFDRSQHMVKVTFQNKDQSWFELSRSKLNAEGEKCLWEFSSVWITNLFNTDPEIRDYISRLVIEGHTDSKKYRKCSDNSGESLDDYGCNLQLSQERALDAIAVIRKHFASDSNESFREWRETVLAASGRGYADLVKENGTVNDEKSRRIEFKLILKSRVNDIKTPEETAQAE